MLYEVDRHNASERLSASPLERGKIEDFSERSMNGSLKLGARDILENGNAGIDPLLVLMLLQGKKHVMTRHFPVPMLEKTVW